MKAGFMISPERAERMVQTISAACCRSGVARACEWSRRSHGAMFVRLRLSPTARHAEPDDWTAETLETTLAIIARRYRVVTIDEAVAGLRGEQPLPRYALVLVASFTTRLEHIDLPRLLDRLGVPCVVSVSPEPLARGIPPWPVVIRLAIRQVKADSVDMYGRRWPLSGDMRRRDQVGGEIVRRLYVMPEPERSARAEELVATWGVNPATLPGLTWYDAERLGHSPCITLAAAGLTGDSLLRQPLDRAIYELEEARTLMQERFGAEVRHLDYPWGDWSRVLAEQAARAGYASGVGDDPSSNGMNRVGDDIHHLIARPLAAGTPERVRADLAGVLGIDPLRRWATGPPET